MSRIDATTLAIATVVAAASCAAQRPTPSHAPQIWDVRAARFISEDELVERLAVARYRLLGEVHDNPEHHRIRAGLIRQIAAKGARPAVVFEQFNAENEPTLAAAQRSSPESTGAVDAERIATAGALD